MSEQIKIAIATEDGIHVSVHFGRAPYFQVLTIENRQVIASERRDKAFHRDDHHQGEHHGGWHDTHAGGMVGVVRDCVAILAGGMGRPAFAAIQSAGLTPILTDIQEIAQAGRAYGEGTLINRTERLH